MVAAVVDTHTILHLCVHCRLQAQLDAAAAKLEQQSAAAAKAVAEECERHVVAERALQQQVQQLTSQLAVSQVRTKYYPLAHHYMACCAVALQQLLLDAAHVQPPAASHSSVLNEQINSKLRSWAHTAQHHNPVLHCASVAAVLVHAGCCVQC